MKIFRWFIGFSVAANLLLAAWCFTSLPAVLRHEADVAGSSPRETASSLSSKSPSQNGLPGAWAPASATRKGPVTWNDIQSADLKQFIARLRGVGCPEETIQDITLAEVNRRFAARTRQVWPERYATKP